MCKAAGNEKVWLVAYHTPERPTDGDCHMALLNVQLLPLREGSGEGEGQLNIKELYMY